MLTFYGDPDIFRRIFFFFFGGGGVVLLSLKFFVFDYEVFTLAKTVLVKILN